MKPCRLQPLPSNSAANMPCYGRDLDDSRARKNFVLRVRGLETIRSVQKFGSIRSGKYIVLINNRHADDLW
jgi:hypothetical protein